MVIQSVASSQSDILRSIQTLHCPGGFACDLTFGKGGFWKELPAPPLRFDISPQVPGVVQASSMAIPLADASVTSLVFDPPFLTYIRQGREGNGAMIMARQFAGYWTYSELEDHYTATLKEAARVLKPKGILVFKCQDIVHNHRLHCTHANVISWAQDVGLRLKDLFVLTANHRLPSPNRAGAQKHARIFHSYFLVLQKCN